MHFIVTFSFFLSYSVFSCVVCFLSDRDAKFIIFFSRDGRDVLVLIICSLFRSEMTQKVDIKYRKS